MSDSIETKIDALAEAVSQDATFVADQFNMVDDRYDSPLDDERFDGFLNSMENTQFKELQERALE